MTTPKPQTADSGGIEAAAEDWFLRLSSGAATPDDIARFKAWRDAHPLHRSAYAEVREIWNDAGPLRSAFTPTTPIAPMPPPTSRPARSRPRRVMVATAVMAACIAILIVSSRVSVLDFSADFTTGPGEQRTAVLADGSRVILNTDTAIALDFTAERRRVTLLHGEAYFEVRKDAARPFDVLAQDGRSTAVGTAFAVRATDDSTLVSVTKGTVRVSSPEQSAGNAKSVLLEAGQQARYGDGTSPDRVPRDGAVGATAWRHGTIVIDNLPLSRALAEIDRYRPGRIVMLGDASRQEPITARIEIGELDGGIRALAGTHGLSVTKLTNYLLIVH